MEPIRYSNKDRLLHKQMKLRELRVIYPQKVPSSFIEVELNLIIDSLTIEVDILYDRIEKCKQKLKIYKDIINDVA